LLHKLDQIRPPSVRKLTGPSCQAGTSGLFSPQYCQNIKALILKEEWVEVALRRNIHRQGLNSFGGQLFSVRK